jgi:hypothetical protein
MPNTMEVFWIASNGAVNESNWYSGVQDWQTKQLAPPGSASTTGRITAVSRSPGMMEVFYIGSDGTVQYKFWYNNVWRGYNLTLANAASLTGGITAVSRGPNTVAVWFVAADGSVQVGYCDITSSHPTLPGSWSGDVLAGPGSASLKSSITAVTRSSTTMEMWYIDVHGSVQDESYQDGVGWRRTPVPTTVKASVDGGIAAVSRMPNLVDLCYIGADGSVQDVRRQDGGGWLGSPIADHASKTSSPSAIAPTESEMAVYFIGDDGSVKNRPWDVGTGWGNVSSIAGAGSAMKTDGVASVSRMPNAKELWYTGADGSVQGEYLYNDSMVSYSNYPLAGAGSAP